MLEREVALLFVLERAVALLFALERAVVLLYLGEVPLEVFTFDLPLRAVLPLLRVS